MTMRTYNVGIIGAGHIAGKMGRTLLQMPRVASYAVASRDYARACDFARRWQFARAYGSYEELVADPAVDIVYVATPHSLHYAHARMCLEAGKAVVCEKAFTLNGRQASALMELSERRRVFITEAIWTRYMPLSARIHELVWSGRIGRPRTLSANLCYPISHKERVMSPGLGGGALLDIGVYALNFASMVFGDDVARVDTSCQLAPTGVDAQHTVTLWYGDGRMATLYSSIYAKSDRMGIVSGDDGHIIVENINNPSSVRVVDRDYRTVETIAAPPQVTGFEYEVGAAVDALDRGDIESPLMPHSETVRMMQLMDSLRDRWGVVFPGDADGL